MPTSQALPHPSRVASAADGPLRLRSFVALIAPGALVAGLLDATFAVVALAFVLDRYSIVGCLQYIASGVLGERAFDAGLAGAGLGLLVHWTVAFSVAGAYALLAIRFSRLQRTNGVLVGVVYGAVVWIVMDRLVLPLTGVPETNDGLLYFTAFLVDHALFVGLPIVLLTHAGLRRSRAASA